MGNEFSINKFRNEFIPDLKDEIKNAFDSESKEYSPEGQKKLYKELIDVVNLLQEMQQKKEQEHAQFIQGIRELRDLQKELEQQMIEHEINKAHKSS